MILKCHPSPSEALVAWAYHTAVPVRAAADRPWFWAPPPLRPAAFWEYQCRCRRGPVRVQRYPCANEDGWVYVGQCKVCETIVWTFRPLASYAFPDGPQSG